MKKFLPIIMLTALLGLCCCSKPLTVPRSIENPVVDGQNASTIRVTGVDLTDSTTVLRVHADFRPGYWMRISSGSQIEANGVRYPILGGEGITPDSLLWMPESGQADFSLIFPAIPAETESIDFIEADGEGEWHIWGIDLTGAREPSWLGKVPAKLRREADLNAPMQPALLDTGTTRIDFRMLNYKKDMPSKLNVYYYSLGSSQQNTSVKLDSLGNGTLETWFAGTTIIYLVDENAGMSFAEIPVAPGEHATVYLAPVQSNLVVSSRDSLPRFYVDGHYAPTVAAIEALQKFEINSMPDLSYTDTDEEWTEKIIGRYKATVDSIEASDLPKMAKERLLAKTQGWVMDQAVIPTDRMKFLYLQANGWDSTLPDSFGFTELTPEQKKRIGALFDFGSPDLLMANLGGYPTMDAADVAAFGASTNLPAEFSKFSDITASPEKITDADIDTLATFSSPFFAAAAKGHKAAYDRLASSAAMQMIQPAPEVEADAVFDAIVAPHKGKVVMVDLWNTWCGPCRRALAANEPEKSGDLKSDDIVWIYIANETSPLDKYLEMIPDIKGIHYRLNDEQWAAIRSRFNVDGIPFYILVDRDGKATGRPDLRDHDLFKKEILNKLNGK